MKAWRLSRQRYAAAALTGEGSAIFGGRWNSPGVPVVYASPSLPLAVLEVFVHMSARAEPDEYVSVCVELPIELQQAERVEFATLPKDWRSLELPALKAIGDAWAASRRSLALLVPSVIVEGEWNVLINPQHPDAKKMTVEKPKLFRFDERMFMPRR